MRSAMNAGEGSFASRCCRRLLAHGADGPFQEFPFPLEHVGMLGGRDDGPSELSGSGSASAEWSICHENDDDCRPDYRDGSYLEDHRPEECLRLSAIGEPGTRENIDSKLRGSACADF